MNAKALSISVTRREYIKLAIASFCCVVSCIQVGPMSSIRSTNSELKNALARIPSDQSSELTEIANEIEETSTQMIKAHVSFVQEFEQLSADRSVTRSTLLEVSSSYDAQRVLRRDKLLELQKRLQLIVDDDWPEIAEIMYNKADAIALATSLEI